MNAPSDCDSVVILIQWAIFDACVLCSAPLRDFLLRLAEARLIRPAKSVNEYLTTLERQGLVKTVAFLREREIEI